MLILVVGTTYAADLREPRLAAISTTFASRARAAASATDTLPPTPSSTVALKEGGLWGCETHGCGPAGIA